MNKLSTNQVRRAFLDFFVGKGHTEVKSSSLIPHNDPTLLFANAGMNQFKDVFLGLETREYKRATTSQKCVRAGGKHNDLDNVGYTARHHTFFEMLGNFSFGDYFKPQAIAFAWEFLTSSAWLGLPADRLYVTIYHTDDEAYDIWHKNIGLAQERIIRIGDKGALYESDNFWAMGDTGPCGPCTEIFYDHGPDVYGGLPGTKDEDGDRFIEIWNCVFMQFNRQKDGTLLPLPKPSVDTGMGLERISAIMQGKHGNYEIDTFVNLMDAAATILDIANENQASLKVIADHIRASAFLIADGVLPGNEGRGYVLRRIIRRAVRHGNKLGAKGAFFHQMVAPLVREMGEAYPELITKKRQIEGALLAEEIQFEKTLAQGLRLLEDEARDLKDGDTLAGSALFRLYDTYGFPIDLTADILRERGILVDEAGFNVHMQAQKDRARAAGKFDMDYASIVKVDQESIFLGYEDTQGVGHIVALYVDGVRVDTLTEGQEALVVLNQTPFYGESGGQVGDTGEIRTQSGIFLVEDTQKSGGTIIHRGQMQVGTLEVNQTVDAKVDANRRHCIAQNHSATHLLHGALRARLGAHVTQKGSMVAGDLLRFDFSHDKALTREDIREIERLVNGYILQNNPVTTRVMDIEEAQSLGAMMLFDEKYGDKVRVVGMGAAGNDIFSLELCGGTHVTHTGAIGQFRLISEGAIGAGIRRVEAVTGMAALELAQEQSRLIYSIDDALKAQKNQTLDKLHATLQQVATQTKEIEALTQKLSAFYANSLLDTRQTIAGTEVVLAHLPVDANALKSLSDVMKPKFDGLLCLVGTTDKTAILVTSGNQHKAGDIVRILARTLGGKGGGKTTHAQGGAPLASDSAIQEAFTAVQNHLKEQDA